MKCNHKFVAIKEVSVGRVLLGDNNIKEGEVMSCGEEVKNLQEKDMVVFDANKAIKHSIKGQEYYFINYETVFCTL